MRMDLCVRPIRELQGRIKVPGDKSLSHRGAIIGALASGQTRVEGFLRSEDCLSTLVCLSALGVQYWWAPDGSMIIQGNGLQESTTVLDVGNSGTTIRLLAGVLAGQDFFTVIHGDDSLAKRPMQRVTIPLRQMGAMIDGRQDGNLAPLAIRGGKLKGIKYTSPVASAQVKSALLLAGLFAKGVTEYQEPYLSRDHTERLFTYFGLPVIRENNTIYLDPGIGQLKGRDLFIPGDISSGAFFLVAAACLPGSELLLKDVGINPTRTGVIDVLRQMGAQIEVIKSTERSGEPVADLLVRGGPLQGTVIEGQMVPRLIDEIPVLVVAASQAEGTTIIKNAEELRVKEVNRIDELVTRLFRLGVIVQPQKDGLIIQGPQRIRGGLVDGGGDHRLAMSLAVAGLLAEEETVITGFECAEVSFPGFVQVLRDLAVDVELS